MDLDSDLSVSDRCELQVHIRPETFGSMSNLPLEDTTLLVEEARIVEH